MTHLPTPEHAPVAASPGERTGTSRGGLPIDHPIGGTEVIVHYRPLKHSHNTVLQHPTHEVTVPDVYLEERDMEQVLHVRGPVDAAAVKELEAQLALSTTPGALDLVIDHEGVTMLSSASTSVIRAGLRRADSIGVVTQVRCRASTVAQQVLALTPSRPAPPAADGEILVRSRREHAPTAGQDT